MDNSNNLSSAKTVAGENSNEIINEQAEVAQVSNSNESIAMNTANSQSSMAPQVGTNETAPSSGVQEAATVSDKESAVTASPPIILSPFARVIILINCCISSPRVSKFIIPLALLPITSDINSCTTAAVSGFAFNTPILSLML